MVKDLQRILNAWLIPLLGLLFLGTIIFIFRGQFNLYGLSDAFLLPGIITFSLTMLRLISRTGTYDVAGYGINSLRDSFRKDGKKNFKSLHDYQEQKNKQRNKYSFSVFPIITISIIFILISVVLAYFSLN